MEQKAKIIQISPLAKLMLAGSLVFGAIDTVLIPVPYLAAWLILEHLAGNTIWPMDQIFFWVFMAIGARWLASLLSTTLSHLSAMQVTTDLRTRLLEHLGRLPMHWHAGQTRGGLKKVFTSDIGEVESFLAHHIPDTVSALLLPILSLICLLWVNWILGLLLVLLFVACILVQAASLARMNKGSILGRYNKALEDLKALKAEDLTAEQWIEVQDMIAKVDEAYEKVSPELVEEAPTREFFANPREQRTQEYLSGRFS